MKNVFKKPLRIYVIGIFIFIAITGSVLSQVVDDLIVLIAVLVTELIVLLIILLHIFDNYMKPIKKATATVDELVKGNYRARIHHTQKGSFGELSYKINALARNLSELSIHEQIQSEQLSTVLDNTESGLVLIDEKGYIHFVNRKFMDMFGGVDKDYKGFLYYDVLENEVIHETVQETFLYEEDVKKSFTHFKGLDKHYREIVGAPIFNERNILKGTVLVLYDITEMKKLELMRKDFVANVSHELKTPITSIKGFAETMLENNMANEKQNNEFLSIIHEESHRMQLLIEDLLTLSRLEREDFFLQLAEVRITELVDEISPIAQHKANDHNLQLTIDVAENLTLMADKEKVKQIIINLLDNSFSYTPADGHVLLSIHSTAHSIHIEVKDTGIGIAQEMIPRIFERFYRVDKARSRNTGGTGLGLAIVKHIVEVHGGHIDIESEVDKGTSIHVYLPKGEGK
ncbi:two-component system phosphate regulon sensor histidine kinase PhoR [Virgibacillus halotolerans]|uniref:two-component system histidine kinase PnpS n=1 Tax=Virgibacillus halotolerans TaxID=1071053 RepID=UPI00195F92F3|nr:HAMP domain-containing sensor histidine kinase [Virgibacillus halotolerans]MBM7597730.1 two-component system phosphate regulon sensor histidine kinase PhoR [Virgibacillus halotolerans]